MLNKPNKKKNLKNKKLFFILSCVITVILIFVLLLLLLPRFNPISTGRHITKNALPEEYSYYPYLKDGNIYIYENGQSVLAGEKVYDANVPSTVAQADYVWDLETRQIIYLSDPNGERKLMHYKDGTSKLIASHVDSWLTVVTFEKTAIVTGADSNAGTGNLLQYSNGGLQSLDFQIQTNSIRFSPDGSRLFALKGSTSASPDNTAMLVAYDSNGNRTELQQNVSSLSWVSGNGETYISIKENSAQDNLYNYKIANKNNKAKEIDSVYLSATAYDSSLIYMIADYNAEKKTGSLIAMDTVSLIVKKLADNVSYMNPEAVNDLSKGIVYSVPTAVQDRYNIYYAPVNGKRLLLIRDAYENSLMSISLNTQTNTGYILVNGITASQNTLHYITWDKSKIISTKLDTGSIYEIVYYEASDTVLYIKNGDGNCTELYKAKGTDKPKRLLISAGAIYDKDNNVYYSCSLLSNDGKKLLYFKNLVTMSENSEDPFYTHPLSQRRGTLMMLDIETTEITKIADNVQSDLYDSVAADSDMSHIYYSVLTGTSFNLYLYSNNASTLIAENVSGPLKFFIT